MPWPLTCDCGRERCRLVSERGYGGPSNVDVAYPAVAEPDAAPAEALCVGYAEVPGLEVDCFACQVSGPWSAADGTVVYCTPEPRHHHQGATDVSPRDL
jgi:hypothetical protein